MTKEEIQVQATILKKNIGYILEKVKLNNKWKSVANVVFDKFHQRQPKKYLNNKEGFERFIDLLKKNVSDPKRHNVKFLTELYDYLRELEDIKKLDIPDYDISKSGDSISKLCNKYLDKFLKRDFRISEQDLENLIKNADIGNTLARRTMGDYYLYGGNLGIPNFIEAHRYYSLAVEDNCYISAYQLGQMYESENGFFNHKPIAYKYYELALQYYFLQALNTIQADNSDYPMFPNVFSKVAYYEGYLKAEIDNETFFAIAYLGYKAKDIISILYVAYALLVGKGCEVNVDLAIEVYQSILSLETSNYFKSLAISRLAIIYRDLLNDDKKFLCYKEQLRAICPPEWSEKELVFNIENKARVECVPTYINHILNKYKCDLWNSNSFTQGIYKTEEDNLYYKVSQIEKRETSHQNFCVNRTIL